MSGAEKGTEPRWGGCYIRSCYQGLSASVQPSRKVGRNRFSHGKLPTERGNARRTGSGEGHGDDAPAAHPAGADDGSAAPAGSCRWEETKAWSKDGGKD